tara:strand:+ start:28255 stop:28509 length:255 start_codon:yes stop_codon:yes gene_type:complete
MGVNSNELINQKERTYTINTTFKVKGSDVVVMENTLIGLTEMIDYKVIPDTSKLYEEDEVFKKLVKHVKTAQKERDLYINSNHK